MRSISAEIRKIAVLISGSGSNLQALIDAVSAGAIDGNITAVISNRPDVKGLQRARDAGIPALTVDHTDFDSREQFDRALISTMDAYEPDLVVLAGFMRILTPAFISHYSGRLLNIHPSLLPKYPGLHTHRRALEAGDTEAGATVHFVTEELDGGPAIIQARVPVETGDDESTLAARVLTREHQIYPLAVQWYCQGRLRLAESGAELDGQPLARTGVAHPS